MAVRIAGSTFDCREARPVATFWAGLRGFDVASWSDEEGALIEDPAGREPWIGFARVPEAKAAKNRCHPDLTAEDFETEVARAEGMRGRTLDVHREPFWDWNVMVDPEGNEFCLGRPLEAGAIGGWAFDCADDARAAARFWAQMLGFDEREGSPEGVLLVERVEGTDPWHWIWLARVPEPKAAKNRFHLDLETDELDAEIGRVERLGGRTLAVHRERSWDWNAMTDPEGNEFCLGRTRSAAPDPPGRDAR